MTFVKQILLKTEKVDETTRKRKADVCPYAAVSSYIQVEQSDNVLRAHTLSNGDGFIDYGRFGNNIETIVTQLSVRASLPNASDHRHH